MDEHGVHVPIQSTPNRTKKQKRPKAKKIISLTQKDLIQVQDQEDPTPKSPEIITMAQVIDEEAPPVTRKRLKRPVVLDSDAERELGL